MSDQGLNYVSKISLGLFVFAVIILILQPQLFAVSDKDERTPVVKLVVLDDGTKCAVLVAGYASQSISCDWSGKK